MKFSDQALRNHSFDNDFGLSGCVWWARIGPKTFPGGVREGPGRVPERFLEPSWFRFPFWSSFRASPGPAWGPIGAFLGPSWAIWGLPEALLGPSWGCFGSS